MEKNDGLLSIWWMDNAVVTIISTSCGVQVNKMKQFFSEKKKRQKLVIKYIKYIESTD